MRPSCSMPHRLALLATVGALAVVVPGTTAPAAAATPAAASGATTVAAPEPPSDPATTASITNGKGLTVQVGREFPQVVSYDVGGRRLTGQAERLSRFTINGTAHTATTTVTVEGDHAAYHSTFEDLPDLSIDSTITATDRGTVVFAVTRIGGSAAPTVDELSIPDQSLVSVDSTDPAATLARTRISADSTTTADRFVRVTGDAPVDKAAVGTPYGFVSGTELSAGLLTNATEDSAQGNNDNGNTRLLSRVTDAGNGTRRASLSVGTWTYAAAGATDPRVRFHALPQATVVLAADRNDDGAVTWQDAAIAYRDVMTHPEGSERVPDRVVAHIPFNFASQATNPFLKTLDNVKRISATTDDLGQWVLEKGYGNEGHDSANTDYGGDVNTRAGGAGDLNTLVREGAKYNADLAVHVNATEAYPQARAFSDALVAGRGLGWNWLNQSYGIDQRRDLGTGAVLDRFAELRKDVPGLKGLYIDVYYSSGWLADELADELHSMGFEVATEWAYKFEGDSIWSHWSNDKNYGGATNKGINSDIVRFIANSDRDVWNTDPLLGGSQIKEFEGWTGQNSWDTFYSTIWTSNLPTKFLQHYDLLRWDKGRSAALTGGVSVAMVDGRRQVRMGDTTVLDGGTYLLPWGETADNSTTSSPSRATKMYYYNADGGSRTFTLTPQFADVTKFGLYALTDQGRVKVTDVTPKDGRVTLTGDKATPYVLAPLTGTTRPAPVYGTGTLLHDPGFNAGNLTAWDPSGGAHVERTATGDNVAVLGSKDSGVSQGVQGLTPGARYQLSADVEIGPGERRPVTLRLSGKDTKAVNAFDTTPVRNTMAADAKKGTWSQRAAVDFTAPATGNVAVQLRAVAGSARVALDDVRLVRVTTVAVPTPVSGDSTQPSRAGGDIVAAENFEGSQPAWGPFVKGDAGGATDPRTSISQLHDPYSQKGWKNTHAPFNAGSLAGKGTDDVVSGNHSLKSHEENSGLVYRTVPATVPFVAGHSYTVRFRYQNSLASQFAWVTGADTVAGGSVRSKDLTVEPMPQALDTASYDRTFTAGCGDAWVGLRRTGSSGGADFVLDDFTVTDHGPAAGGAACGTVSAPASASLSPGTANRYTTSFTNNDSERVTNVAMSLGALPDGWTVQVAEQGGNLFAGVDPGQTVRTTWLLTPPAAAAGTSADLRPTATYFHRCTTKSVSTSSTLTVATRAMVPTESMTATADSEEKNAGPSEGPVANVLDGDLGTIWHTQYDPTVTDYPHWVRLALDATSTVDGFGYQDRQGGGPNGRVKDYTVSVSQDGASWTRVASGTLKDVPEVQVVSFPAVQARYVRFDALNALNGQPFAAAAEMRVYGTSPTPVTGWAPAPRPDDTACTP